MNSPAHKISDYNQVVFDLDGTILNDVKELHQSYVDLMFHLIELGKDVVVATARPFRGITAYLSEDLRSRISLILYNGTQIYINDKLVKQFDIPAAAVRDMYDDLAADFPGIIFGFEFEDQCYTCNHFSRHWEPVYEKKIDYTPDVFKDSPKVLVDLTDKRIRSFIEDRYSAKHKVLFTDQGELCQIMAAGTSKSAALKYLNDSRQMEDVRTVCFGDDHNDVDLFKSCKYPVALENSIPELKELACMTVGSNNERGVMAFFGQDLQH